MPEPREKLWGEIVGEWFSALGTSLRQVLGTDEEIDAVIQDLLLRNARWLGDDKYDVGGNIVPGSILSGARARLQARMRGLEFPLLVDSELSAIIRGGVLPVDHPLLDGTLPDFIPITDTGTPAVVDKPFMAGSTPMPIGGEFPLSESDAIRQLRNKLFFGTEPLDDSDVAMIINGIDFKQPDLELATEGDLLHYTRLTQLAKVWKSGTPSDPTDKAAMMTEFLASKKRLSPELQLKLNLDDNDVFEALVANYKEMGLRARYLLMSTGDLSLYGTFGEYLDIRLADAAANGIPLPKTKAEITAAEKKAAALQEKRDELDFLRTQGSSIEYLQTIGYDKSDAEDIVHSLSRAKGLPAAKFAPAESIEAYRTRVNAIVNQIQAKARFAGVPRSRSEIFSVFADAGAFTAEFAQLFKSGKLDPSTPLKDIPSGIPGLNLQQVEELQAQATAMEIRRQRDIVFGSPEENEFQSRITAFAATLPPAFQQNAIAALSNYLPQLRSQFEAEAKKKAAEPLPPADITFPAGSSQEFIAAQIASFTTAQGRAPTTATQPVLPKFGPFLKEQNIADIFETVKKQNPRLFPEQRGRFIPIMRF